MSHHYRCPKCGGSNLGTHVLTTARLSPEGVVHQDGGELEFDGTYTTWCNDCGYCDAASGFWLADAPDPYP